MGGRAYITYDGFEIGMIDQADVSRVQTQASQVNSGDDGNGTLLIGIRHGNSLQTTESLARSPKEC